MASSKRRPLRRSELRALRAVGGLPCHGVLNWDMVRGMLRSKDVDGKRHYSFQCPNCKVEGTATKQRRRCGRKLM